jgi:hypothetical protein
MLILLVIKKHPNMIQEEIAMLLLYQVCHLLLIFKNYP